MLEHVAHVVAVDINDGMLAAARDKLASAVTAGRATVCRGVLDALPVADRAMDAVLVNQVLHHLPGPGGEWPALRAVLAEIERVLRPGGSLVVNICSHAQLRRGWWFASLIPEAIDAMCERHPPLDLLESLMRAAGLAPAGRYVPAHVAMQGAHYLDGLGPTRPQWRSGDSIWATVGAGRLDEVVERLREMDRAGELERYVASHDRERAEIGQITFVHALDAR